MADQGGSLDGLSAVDLVEVRVGLSGLTAEVQRMRADMAPLAGLPTQLQANSDLLAERLQGEVKARQRELAAERAAREQAVVDLREDVDQLRKHLTWAAQLVIGSVLLALIDALTGPASGVL